MVTKAQRHFQGHSINQGQQQSQTPGASLAPLFKTLQPNAGPACASAPWSHYSMHFYSFSWFFFFFCEYCAFGYT